MMNDEQDQYEHWRANIAGEIKAYHDEPEPGFYKMKTRDGSIQPVSIWRDAKGAMKAKIGGKPADAGSIWTYVCDKPIEYDLYTSVLGGGAWPDETPGIDLTPEAVKDKAKAKAAKVAEAGGIGHNQPPDDADEHARLEYDIMDVGKAIEEALAGKLETKNDADTLSNLRDKANDLHKKADALRKAEKKPYDDLVAAVQARWVPMLTKAKKAADSARGPLGKLIVALEAIKSAALKAADPEMSDKEIEDASKTRVGGRMAKRASTRTVVNAVIDDYDLLMAEIQSYDEVRALAQQIATKVVRAGGKLPGVSKAESKVAV